VDEDIKNNSLIDFDMKRIKHKNIDDNMNIDYMGEINEKVLVKQAYDNKLTSDEKIARTIVVNEEKDYKNKIEMLKKKKEREREERLERIKKMKIN
jgi:hypothetical protein